MSKIKFVQTPNFVIYFDDDGSIVIYNAWDSSKSYGLVLSNSAEVKELVLICENISFLKNPFELLQKIEQGGNGDE